MYIKEIWRYPVKSMAGESLQAATLAALGVEGDRIIQARNARGRPITLEVIRGCSDLRPYWTATEIR
jgi:uncharacterized protein YcbX